MKPSKNWKNHSSRYQSLSKNNFCLLNISKSDIKNEKITFLNKLEMGFSRKKSTEGVEDMELSTKGIKEIACEISRG